MAICRATWKIYPGFVFLPQLMASCHRRATKHSFLMIHTLVTCCLRLAGKKNTSSFADTCIIRTSNVYVKYVTANKVDVSQT